MKQVLSALLCCFAATVGATKVAVLAEHNPTTCGSDGSQAVVECNLKVYIDATKVAAKAEVQLLVLPEGYGLVGSPSKTSFYEPLAVVVGSAPCRDLDAATHPVQAGLGCAAANQSIAIASNVFTTLPSNGTHYITEIVFDSTGTVIAIYHKHELFPIEEPKVNIRRHGCSPLSPLSVFTHCDLFGFKDPVNADHRRLPPHSLFLFCFSFFY